MWYGLIAAHLREQVGQPDQCLIPGVVPVGVVDLLEVVYVEDQQGERIILSRIPPDFVV